MCQILPFSLSEVLWRQGRILVGPRLEVSGKEDVYALGDCAEDRWQETVIHSILSRILAMFWFRQHPLGMLAQVANQQGKHLANSLNRSNVNGNPNWRVNTWWIKSRFQYLLDNHRNQEMRFKYQFLGSMAQLGTWDAVVDMGAGSKGTLSVSY